MSRKIQLSLGIFMISMVMIWMAWTMIFAGPADVEIKDPYMRVNGAAGTAAAGYMVIENQGGRDKLLSVSSPVARMVELHMNETDDNGVMMMRPVSWGIALPRKGEARLERGGNHIMFMGLSEPLADGDLVDVTLKFEKAGEVTVQIPVDSSR